MNYRYIRDGLSYKTSRTHLVNDHDFIIHIYGEIICLDNEVVLGIRVCGQRHLFWGARIVLVFLYFLRGCWYTRAS